MPRSHGNYRSRDRDEPLGGYPRHCLAHGMAQQSKGNTVSPGAPGPQQNTVCSGWVLKKRRKKMQGFARRYFTLQADGVLSYSAHFQGSPRDHIILPLATVSSNERARELHIDSGTATFHLKCLSAADFDTWMRAFRTFMNVRVGVHTSDQDITAAMTTAPTKTDTSSIRTLHAQPRNRLPSFPTKLGLVVQQIDKIIHDLEETVSEASSQHVPPPLNKKRSTQNIKSRKEPGNAAGKESKDGHSKKDDSTNSLFGLFHRRTSTPRQPSDDSSSTSSINPVPKEEHQLPTHTPSHTSSPVTSTYNDTPLLRLTHQIAALRTQHALLMSLIEGDNIVPTPPSSLPAISSLIFNAPSSLATYTDEGVEQRRQVDHRTTSGEIIRPSSSLLSLGELTRRRSLATLGSTGESIWYDAEEGVEFFSVETVSHHSIDEDNGSGPGNETSTETMTLDEERPPHLSQISNTSSVTAFDSQPGVEPTPVDVERRTHLPSPTSGDEISLFTVLKRNVGKDLSTVSFPVSFNEPLSLLQHLAEDLEYIDLLEKAVQATDPVERLSFVATFVVSGYACTKLRASRKPFNPMLGETFEDVRYKFISEKVSHHPPIMACHAEGEGWEFWGTSGGKNRFWGKSLEIIPVGTTYLKIGEETYSWQKPSSFMRNLIAGEKYLEHCGIMTIHSTSSPSSLSCTLEFKPGGYWGTRDEVVGRITSNAPIGTTTTTLPVDLRGRWDQSFSRLLDPSGSHLHVLWRAAPFPPNAPQYYGFTQFAIQLNEITPDIEHILPPTDSRWRPDQRALEEGRVEEADREKARIEQAQRERRKQRELRGEEWAPRWFHPVPGKDGSEEWVYNGGYWEARETGRWGSLELLW